MFPDHTEAGLWEGADGLVIFRQGMDRKIADIIFIGEIIGQQADGLSVTSCPVIISGIVIMIPATLDRQI